MPADRPVPSDVRDLLDPSGGSDRADEGRPTVTIYHYNRCSKSRAAMDALQQADVEIEVRDYMENPPGRLELLGLIESTGGDPRPFVRTNEDEAAELGEADLSDASKVATFLAEHPEALQRPILLSSGRAVIARRPGVVEAFLDEL